MKPNDTGSIKLPVRHHPAHGVKHTPHVPLIIFVTVCTYKRQPWLAAPEIHELLRSIWISSTAWLIGRYIIMPDHIHLFAGLGSMPLKAARQEPRPPDTRPPHPPLDNWIRFWKSQFSKLHNNPDHRWQIDHWDTRLRHNDSYRQKSAYVFDNPVRHGLVRTASDWPFRGELNILEW